MYGGATAPLGGQWAICNGASVSRTTYAALFQVLGTSYGSSNVNSFNLPDLRGDVVRCYGNAPYNTMGATGGAENFTLGTQHIPPHNHSLAGGGYLSQTAGLVNNKSLVDGGDGQAYNNQYNATSIVVTGSAGGGQPFSIANSYTVLQYIIKVA